MSIYNAKVEIGDVYYFPMLSIGFWGRVIGGMCVVIGFDTEHQNMPVLVSERMTIVKEAEYNILTKLKKVGHIDVVHEVLKSLEDLKRGDV